MSKYLIIYNSTDETRQAAAATPEQVKASMNEWMLWKDEAEKTVNFEWGLPLKPGDRMTAGGSTSPSPNQATGYSFMEGEKERILEALKSHPHLKREGSTIDVFEMIPMDQMQGRG